MSAEGRTIKHRGIKVMKRTKVCALFCFFVVLAAGCFAAACTEEHTHDYQAEVTAPTCTEQGYTTYTCPEDGESYVNFAGLTDASVESENQGDINRSLNCYAPDISHHVQEIIRRADETNYKDYDIWMLTMAKEIVETDSGSNSALSDYYQNLAYYDYYNSMYNPYGYGGYYGGYYGYDSYYGMSNYYNYMLAAQYASSQNSSTTTMSIQLDKDRYYRGVLYGPNENPSTREEKMKAPRLIVTYSTVK